MSELKQSGKILNSVDMSASFTSDPVYIADSKLVCVHLYSAATGTRAGTFYIEASNDGTNYVTLATVTVTASTLLNWLSDIETAAKYMQLRYVASSGTGTGDGYVSKKA